MITAARGIQSLSLKSESAQGFFLQISCQYEQPCVPRQGHIRRHAQVKDCASFKEEESCLIGGIRENSKELTFELFLEEVCLYEL